MVAIPTNYKMGTGLAATIMGQQAGLEAEQTGLQNLYKAMQMPQEALKGQEAAMLMQDPQYLQQKTQNTLIELKNQYSASDFQQTLDAANRVRIRLDAAGGDPAKEQQIVQESLSALKIDPNSEFAQYAMKDPRGALTKFIQGVEVGLTGTGGAKQFGKMAEQNAQDAAAMERAKLQAETNLMGHRISAGATIAAAKERGATEKINEQAANAMRVARDPKATPEERKAARQFLDDLVVYNQSKSSGFAGSGYTPQGGFQPKSEMAPKFNWDQQESSQPVTVEAGGKVYSFPNQAAADSFKQRAGIK